MRKLWSLLAASETKDASTSIQNLAVAAAVVVGGIWAFFTFGQLREVDTAELGLLKLRQETSLISVVDVNVEATSRQFEGDDNHYIDAIVTLQNKGSRPVVLVYKEHLIDEETGDQELVSESNPEIPPFAVAKVSFGDFGPPRFGDCAEVLRGEKLFAIPTTSASSILHIPIGNSSTHKTWQLLRPGQVDRIPFIVKVKDEGLYLATFRVRIGTNSAEQSVYKELVDNLKAELETASVSGSTFVYVPKRSDKAPSAP